MDTFTCPECGKRYEDNDVECCVGGHWTPHKSSDVRPDNASHCCHKYQKEVTK